MIEAKVYTVKEVAVLMKVSNKTVYKMIHDDTLHGIRVRGQIRITLQALQNYLEGGNDG